MNNLLIYKKEKNKYVEIGQVWNGLPSNGVWLIKNARNNDLELISNETKDNNIDALIKNYTFGKKEFFETLGMFTKNKCSLNELTYFMFIIFSLNLSKKSIKPSLRKIIERKYDQIKCEKKYKLFYKANPNNKYSRYYEIENHHEYKNGLFSCPIEGIMIKSESDDFNSSRVIFGLDVYHLFNEKNIHFLKMYVLFENYFLESFKNKSKNIFDIFDIK